MTLALVVGSCSAPEDDAAVPELLDPSGARFLEDGTTPGPEISWMPIPDVDTVIRSADDVFVATLVGTERAVFLLGSDAEDPGGGGTEYDGLVVRIDDVLLGDLAPSEEATLAIPIATVRDGIAERWESSEHLDFVTRHVRTLVESGEPTRYLLFTVDRGDTKHVYGRVGIVEVDQDGAFLRMIPGSEFSATAGNRFVPPDGGWSVDAVRQAIG
ncbi:MAG: hypothetical protein AAGE98_07325 [Actinomycetota bacterium]